jgi:diacylglycerol kinase (ATP)
VRLSGPLRRRPRRLLVIFNPAAGGSRSKRFERVIAALRQQGCSVVVRATNPAAGDAERLAREAETEFDAIVAAGGDGTINAVANGMRGRAQPLAIVPLGTANVLGNELTLPCDPRRLAAVIAEAEPRPIWPGRIGDRLFLTMAGSGFDAEVVEAVDPRLKRRVGKFAFGWAILVCLWRYRRGELIAEIDGVAYRAASVIVAKGHFYAGRFVLAPEAHIADPRLQVVLFRTTGRLAALRYLAAMVFGRVHRLPDVAIIAARNISLAATAQAAVHADGEIIGHLPIMITVAEAPIQVIQPPPRVAGAPAQR